MDFFPDETLEFEAAVTEWGFLDQEEDDLRWKRAEIAAKLKPVYGEETLHKFALQVGVADQTIWQYRQVYLAYKNSTRVEFLSWTHHREVMDRDDRLDWLKKAETNRWSVRRMLEEIQKDDESRRVTQIRCVVTPNPASEPPQEFISVAVRTVPATKDSPVSQPKPIRVAMESGVPARQPATTRISPFREWLANPEQVQRHQRFVSALRDIVAMEDSSTEAKSFTYDDRNAMDDLVGRAIDFLTAFRRERDRGA